MPEIDLTGRDWENKTVQNVLGGLVLNQDSELMQDSQFLTLDGLNYRKNAMQKDTGYKIFADKPSGTPGLFRGEFKHITAAGVANTFAASTLSFYVLANSGANWHMVSSGTSTTIDLNVLSNDTIIPVTSTVGFSVNDIIALVLDDGSHHVSTIASINIGVSITIDDAVPAVPTIIATSGNAFIKGVLLAGTSEKHVFALTIPWNDWLVFTNGINIVQYYDPSTTFVQVVPNLPAAGNTICESLALFDTSLILIRTTEGGTNFNQRIRWSDKADATEWVTGDAGSVDLLDSEDNLQRALNIGPYLAIYRNKSIYRGTAVNTSIKRFQWDRVVTAHGVLSPASVVDIGDKHFVVGNRQVYIYGGGFDVQPVGDSIKDLLYGPEAELDIATSNRTFCIYLEARNDVWIFYQTSAAVLWPDKVLRWFGDLNTWSIRKFNTEFLGFGEATQSNSFTWNDIIGSWEDQTWNWNSSGISGDLETILLSSSDGNVMEYNFLESDDNGIVKTYTIETPDFAHPNGVIRTDYLEVKCLGANILVEVSIDKGGSWQTIETINPGTTLKKVRIFKQVASRTIRYRFSGSGNFAMSWYSLRVTLETEN